MIPIQTGRVVGRDRYRILKGLTIIRDDGLDYFILMADWSNVQPVEVNIRRRRGHHSTQERIVLGSGRVHIAHRHRLHWGVPGYRRTPRYRGVVGEVEDQPVSRIDTKPGSVNRIAIIHVNITIMREASGTDLTQ